MTKISSGTWVEIQKQVLSPEERSPAIPEDTKKCPYILCVSGFLHHDASLGDEVSITTLAGRTLNGELVRENPSYNHSFGSNLKEILRIAKEDIVS
jgi:hypothetical protein